MLNEESNNLKNGIQSGTYSQNNNKVLVNNNTPSDLNSLISNLRVSLKEQNPELSLHLDRMLNTIPNDSDQKLIRFQY